MNQQTALVERIENKIDKEVAGGLALASGGASITVAPASMGEVMEFAKMMAISGIAVRPAFRGNPGACLGVAMQAFRWGMDPFAVTNKAYVVKNKSGDEQIAYEAQLIHAVVNERAPLQKRLKPSYSGEGVKRVCKISGLLKGETEPAEYESPEFAKIQPKNSPLWTTDPDQQQFYYSVRAWARRHVPEVLLGVYTEDEMERGPEYARDVTPPARPTRASVALPQAEPGPEGGQPADEPEAVTFEFVDAAGEIIVYPDAGAYADAFITEMRRSPREIDVQGIWETNSQALDSLRAIGAEGENLAEEIHAAYREELDAKKKAERLQAQAAKAPEPPAEDEAQQEETGSDDVQLIEDGSGEAEQAPDDGEALYSELYSELVGKTVAADIHAWNTERAVHMKLLKDRWPDKHRNLVEAANQRIKQLSGSKRKG
jgi:hypothetical protein